MGSTPADLKRDSEYDPDRDELAELRALLLGQQIVELQALQKRLDDPSIRTEEISQILGKAVALSIKRDGGLQRSLYPVVEQALKISVAKNPGMLATSLAPMIGDAVRKAVANALRGMAESINFTLERSLSWESLKWRFEARRTGKSFGQIVLLRSLRYKVQQVILIHAETGSVLQQAKREIHAPGESIPEAELASNMLTALQDYIRDISANPSQDLQDIKMDDCVYWVHHGPQAWLLGQILGTPPPELQNVFARENELIHQEFAVALANFSGDASIFDGARPHLQNCLLGHSERPHKSRRWMVAVAALLFAAAAFGFLVYRRNIRWNHYVARLQSEPGVVLTGWDKHWGRYNVTGLRDPLAADPQKLAADFGIDPAKVEEHFGPYQSLDQHFSLQREFDSEKQALEQLMILFPVNSSTLSPDQSVRLDSIEEHLDKLRETAAELGRQIHLTIYGRADQTGAESKNAALSKQRAEHVSDALRERGFPPDMFSVVGLGNSEPIRHGSEAYQLEVNRSVTLRVESQPQGDRQ
jgi:outer membrane protein OmpA-like peptidoglycan-associated protein